MKIELNIAGVQLPFTNSAKEDNQQPTELTEKEKAALEEAMQQQKSPRGNERIG